MQDYNQELSDEEIAQAEFEALSAEEKIEASKMLKKYEVRE